MSDYKATLDATNAAVKEGFDAGYAQAIKDVVEALRETRESVYWARVAADFIESRFSAASPGPAPDPEKLLDGLPPRPRSRAA